MAAYGTPLLRAHTHERGSPAGTTAFMRTVAMWSVAFRARSPLLATRMAPRAVTLAIRPPIRRVPRHQDLVIADADAPLLHVEIYLLELGMLPRHGIPRYPQRSR